MIPVDPVVMLAFVPAALALNLTPGADMMFCLGQGMRAGAWPAILASAGISIGVLVHTGIAGLGLGALIAAHPAAFDLIRWLGVGYLLWLAVKALRQGPLSAQTRPARAAFRHGLIVNLTNPKVILFVIAFVPQFIDPVRPVLPQFLLLGAVLSVGGFFINGAVGLAAGGIGQRLARSARFARTLGLASAGVFTALAFKLALQQRG